VENVKRIRHEASEAAIVGATFTASTWVTIRWSSPMQL
jgi:hypothetical protein